MNAAYLTGLVLEKINYFQQTTGDEDPQEFFEAASDFFGVGSDIIQGWRKDPATIPVTAIEKVFDFRTLPAFSKPEMHEGKQVVITLPFYKSTNPATAFSIMGLIDRTKTKVMLRWGDAFIIHSRNVLADDFLKTGIEWQLTIDDDEIVPWGNAAWYRAFTGFDVPDKFAGLNTLDRLLSHGKTLVGGLYFGRWKGGKPVYAEGTDDPREAEYARRGPHDVCKPTRWVGTGCMLIHRSVYTDIEKHYPHLSRHPQRQNDGNWFTPDGGDVRRPFEEAMAVLNDTGPAESRASKALQIMENARRALGNQGLGIGEDVSFCLRATDAGHQPHVDMGLLCGHVGYCAWGPHNTKSQ